MKFPKKSGKVRKNPDTELIRKNRDGKKDGQECRYYFLSPAFS